MVNYTIIKLSFKNIYVFSNSCSNDIIFIGFNYNSYIFIINDCNISSTINIFNHKIDLKNIIFIKSNNDNFLCINTSSPRAKFKITIGTSLS